MLKTCYKKADSKESFYELLKESGIQTYERSGKIAGVIFCDYKFRFSRLGFTEERIIELDKSVYRSNELSYLRTKKTREIGVEKGINN